MTIVNEDFLLTLLKEVEGENQIDFGDIGVNEEDLRKISVNHLLEMYKGLHDNANMNDLEDLKNINYTLLSVIGYFLLENLVFKYKVAKKRK